MATFCKETLEEYNLSPEEIQEQFIPAIFGRYEEKIDHYLYLCHNKNRKAILSAVLMFYNQKVNKPKVFVYLNSFENEDENFIEIRHQNGKKVKMSFNTASTKFQEAQCTDLVLIQMLETMKCRIYI